MNQEKTERLEIVGRLYRRGYSYRQIQAEVKRVLDLSSYGIGTVCKDVNGLLEEWKKERLDNVEHHVQLELERIDEACRELWEQWEKSKTDYKKTAHKQKGTPRSTQDGGEKISTYQIEKTETQVVKIGDVSFISEIRKQLEERRKLLGLYAPEKQELTGKDGKDLIPELNLSHLSDEELITYYSLLNKASQK